MNVSDAIKGRRSVRGYQILKIEPHKLDKLWEALRLAPSACNSQPWHFVVVDDAELIRELVSACNKNHFMAEAPLIVVGCADEAKAYPKMAGSMNTFAIDLTIAFDHLTLQAYELGLGTCWIGSFQEDEVKRILKVPQSLRVVALTPIGYPKEVPADRGRKPWSEISSSNYYGQK